MISKELLSEVLGVELFWKDIKIIGSTVHYPHKNGIYNEDKTINIYELAHKCKEWAYSKGLMLVSGIHTRKSNKVWCEIYTHEDLNNTVTQFNEDTEPEAIFKACEWIMEQGKQDE